MDADDQRMDEDGAIMDDDFHLISDEFLTTDEDEITMDDEYQPSDEDNEIIDEYYPRIDEEEDEELYHYLHRRNSDSDNSFSSQYDSNNKSTKCWKSINVNQVEDEGRTALRLAAQNGHCNVISLLVSVNARVNTSDNSGYAPLHVAARNGHANAVSLLLSAKAKVNKAVKTPLIDIDDEDMKDVLQNFGATPLHLAARNGHSKVVELLISAEANVNIAGKVFDETYKVYDDKSPLHLAAENGHKDVVDVLILAKANVNQQDHTSKTPLHQAAHNGHHEITLKLLSAGAEISHTDVDKKTPLHLAAMNGHQDIVWTLITRGAGVNEADIEYKIPLHWAAAKGHANVVSILISQGANVHYLDNYIKTPLHYAAESGNVDVVSLLISAGSNVHQASGQDEKTPLHYAAESGKKDIVSLLISNGAVANQADKNGWTPLYYAAYNGHQDILPGYLPIFYELPTLIDPEKDALRKEIFSLPVWNVTVDPVGDNANVVDAQPMESNENLALRFHGNSPEVIANIAKCLLDLYVPKNCVNLILPMAGLAIELRAETIKYCELNAPADEEYLQCVVGPLQEKALNLTYPIAIIFEIVSHDQGWANDAPNLNGTYHGCWSWFDGQIGDTNESERFRVISNFRANSEFRRHIRCITDPLILRELKIGVAVKLYLRAAFLGWANYVKYARISILYASGHLYNESDISNFLILAFWSKQNAKMKTGILKGVLERRVFNLNCETYCHNASRPEDNIKERRISALRRQSVVVVPHALKCICASNYRKSTSEKCPMHSIEYVTTLPIDRPKLACIPPEANIKSIPPFTVGEEVIVLGSLPPRSPLMKGMEKSRGRIIRDDTYMKDGTFSIQTNDGVIYDGISSMRLESTTKSEIVPEYVDKLIHKMGRVGASLNVCELSIATPTELTQDQLGKMLEQYSKLIALKYLTPINMAIVFSRRSSILTALGRYQEALNDAESAIQYHPNLAKAYFRQGIALASLNKYAEATIAFRYGLKIDASSTHLRHALDITMNHIKN
ncbi:ankyrin repeat domain-containing protein 50-like [Thraustotheca clavata]|uniref:Ankyrin repeat domain-containing protein 50-like n=1 Tax=Thraustotheca clavata TaxID=74557 RepID=A0A1V9YV61_9STRA|nr:ankyrin repeat domain-containing protein 50-like [Thraustotheca clavata]